MALSNFPFQHVYVLSHFSRVLLFATPWTVACQAPLSAGFSRQEYWSGLPFPSPGDRPKAGVEPVSLMSPALQILYHQHHLGSPSHSRVMCNYLMTSLIVYQFSKFSQIPLQFAKFHWVCICVKHNMIQQNQRLWSQRFLELTTECMPQVNQYL